MDEVSYVSGQTRLFGIVGHPIEQVRSPEMITAELVSRGHNAVLVPLHVLPADFETCVRQLMHLQNLDGLVFTTPYKQAACGLAGELGLQAREVGAIGPGIEVRYGEPTAEDIDILLNASPVGMLNDPRIPIEVDHLPAALIVFDAIVKPEVTGLLTVARRSGCRTVFGREMMRGQIKTMVDYFERQSGRTPPPS